MKSDDVLIRVHTDQVVNHLPGMGELVTVSVVFKDTYCAAPAALRSRY